jgi:hypothetical protein
MSNKLVWMIPWLVAGNLYARTYKTETVEEDQKTETKVFCSKASEKDAQQLCEKWLAQQSKSLGERLLTSYCSQGEISTETGCLYRASGELRFVLKKVQTDTEHTD